MTSRRAPDRCHDRRVTEPETYGQLGEAAWRWVLDQVRWDDGPWISESVPYDGGPPEDRDGMHSGIGGTTPAVARLDTWWNLP